MFSKYIEIDGTAIHYFHTGPSTLPDVTPALDRGAMLLFLHDAGGNAHLWHRQLEHFEHAHSAVAFDLPAHGRSGATDGLQTVPEMAALTKDFIQRLRLRPLTIVGQGLGGAIGLQLALTEPSLLRGLVLLSTPATFQIPEATLDVWRDVMRGRKGQPFTKDPFSPKTDFSVMREVWMEQVQTDPRVRYADLLACNETDVTSRLREISTPTLVVAPRDDQVVAFDQVERLQRGIPGARLVPIDDAGHAVCFEQADRVNATIEEWMGGF